MTDTLSQGAQNTLSFVVRKDRNGYIVELFVVTKQPKLSIK